MKQSILLNDISLAFDDAGDGDAIVFVHGHPFNRSMWAPQMHALAHAGYRVIAADLRGYGESTVAADETTLDVFARDVAALLDHLHIERAVLVGLSMGGQIVMDFCRQFPQRVRGLVLAATFPRAETMEGKRLRNALADRLLKEGMTAYAGETLPKMLAPSSIDSQPDMAARVLDMMIATPARGAAAALRGRAKRPAYEPVLAALNLPALIVVGDQDAFTTRDDANEMHALLKHSTLLWMPGVGHMPNLERVDEFNRALIDFMSQVARQ